MRDLLMWMFAKQIENKNYLLHKCKNKVKKPVWIKKLRFFKKTP